MTVKRTALCSALALSAALSIFLSGCGIISFNKGTSPSEETTAPAETAADTAYEKYEIDYSKETVDYLKDLSGNTYDGGTFQIAVAGKNLITPDDSTASVVSKQMLERNDEVEQTLDISLVSKLTDPETMLDEIKAAVRSGSYYADAVMLPQKYIGAYVTSGALINLRSLPGFELNMGYLYPTAVSAGTGGSAVYAVAGPASLDQDCLSCIYFNKSVLDSLGLESPYELVKRGEWTADKYLSYTNAVASLDESFYSVGSQNVTPYLSDLFFFAFGGKLTDSNLGYYPVLSLNGEAGINTVSSVSSAVNVNRAYGSSLDSVNCFLSGKLLFLVDKASTMYSLANAPFDWGVLPLPKLNAQQENYLSLAYYGDAAFFAGIATAPDYFEVADVIADLNIASYGYMRDSYITNAAYYCLRDNTSANMLSYVFSNPVYDFAYSFGEVNSYVSNGTFMAIRNTVAGISSLQRYLDMYNGLFENSMYTMFRIN